MQHNRKKMISTDTSLAVFRGKRIRRIWHDEQWYFSVVDIAAVLTGSADPRNYWKVLKHRLNQEGSEVVTKCNQLKMQSSDGKYYLTDCANTETMLRIIQSIPSRNAEPFKRWLARVGYERIREIEDPELAMGRMQEIYRAKGYSKDWIDKRVRGIAVRDALTDEWDNRGIKEDLEYAILTAEISKATFGLTPSEYKDFKKLTHQNLRDHMTDLELIFTMLGEAATTEIARNKDALGFDENKDAAQRGGTIAGEARRKLEIESGNKVVTPDNYLDATEKRKKLKKNADERP